VSRIVIYGEYPPGVGPAAEATLERVRSHLAGGADVQVVSPRPSAAHHVADLATVRGAALLARLAPGSDLDLTLDPAILGGGPRLAPGQALLALAISRARHTTVRLEPLRGATGRGRALLVLTGADRVEAASPEDADALERARLPRSRLSVRPVAGPPPAPAGATEPDAPAGSREPWNLSENPSREEIEAAIRHRAAADREVVAGSDSPASTGPLHLLGPFVPPPPSSGRPPVAMVKRAVFRLTAWVLMPLVRHVNDLHRATIESLNRHAAAPVTHQTRSVGGRDPDERPSSGAHVTRPER
jgi:hypothetical protein